MSTAKRYSWKKPWLFSTYWNMRNVWTEREAYKRWMLLERHSRLKKPYFNWDGSHMMAELRFAAPGFDPYPDEGFDPRPGGAGGPGDCMFACNPTSLDCKGDCSSIQCICGDPYYYIVAVDDPTGKITFDKETICIDDASDIGEEYPVAVAHLMGGMGQSYSVDVLIIGCQECCDEFEVSGDATADPGATWTGTITPACPGAKCNASSNSGCEITCGVSADGSQVTVTTGGADCGSVCVKVRDPICGGNDTFCFRINNTGQGGAWTYCGQVTASGGCSNQCTNEVINEWKKCGYNWGSQAWHGSIDCSDSNCCWAESHPLSQCTQECCCGNDEGCDAHTKRCLVQCTEWLCSC